MSKTEKTPLRTQIAKLQAILKVRLLLNTLKHHHAGQCKPHAVPVSAKYHRQLVERIEESLKELPQ